MGLSEEITIQEFLQNRESLVGGTIVYWDSLFPGAPIKAEILAIEEVFHEDSDYRDIIVFTDDFVPTVDYSGAPLPRCRHFSFMINPLSASICPACNGMWVVAIPHQGVAHLYYRK